MVLFKDDHSSIRHVLLFLIEIRSEVIILLNLTHVHASSYYIEHVQTHQTNTHTSIFQTTATTTTDEYGTRQKGRKNIEENEINK